MEVLVERQDIHKLIPQREPILLVDQLLSYTEEEAISSFFISPNHIFTAKEGYMIESGMIENIAQTTAMYLGYSYYVKGLPAPEGYIGSIRKMQILELPKVNDTIQTQITVLNEILGVTIVEGKILLNNKIIAQGEMRLVQSK